MNDIVRTPWAPPTGAVALPAVRTEPDPWWWIAPLAGTLAAPVLAAAVSGTANMFAESRFMMTGSLVLSFALILPSWFLARTQARRETRIALVAAGCGLAAGFPTLMAAVGWAAFVVMLLTGNVNG